MLALITKHFYTHWNSISSHHHPIRRHHHQQHRHDKWQQYQILSPWLREGPLGPFCTGFSNTAVGKTPSATTESPSAPSINPAVLIKKCFAVFFIVTILMASYCDAQSFHTTNSVGVTGGTHRVVREVQSLSHNSSRPSPSHSTDVMASTNSSSSTSSSPPNTNGIPGDQQSSHSVVPRERTDSSVPNESATRSELMTLLISTLEKLDILQRKDSSCFRLEKIVSKNIDGSLSPSPASTAPSPDHNMLGVYLYFKEVHIPSINHSETSNVHTVNTSNNTVSVLYNRCVSEPSVEVDRPVWNSLTSERGNDGNGTVVEDLENATADADVYGVLHSGRLSRTQIVVISTCSAIIGMFFLVAGFLRIRNYIKRSRLEQEMASRPKFRSCSVALRGASQSMEQLRRDSLASKISHQNSETTKGSNSSHINGSSRENSSASSPRHDPDTAPLLLLARASQTNEVSTPVEPQMSLQYIDEESVSSKKKFADAICYCRVE